MPDKVKTLPDELNVTAFVTMPVIDADDFQTVRRALDELIKQLPGASVTYTVRSVKTK